MGEAEQPDHAREVDDVGLLCATELGEERPAAVDHAPDVDVDDPAEVLHGLVLEGTGRRDPGVVDEHVHPAVLVDHLLGEGLDAVDHVVLVDFGAFVDLVDMIGGVQVRIDAPLRDPNSGLLLDTPGCVRLDGAQALSLVRARHLQWFDGERWVADPTGDLGRMDRQRAFVAALLGAARSELPSPWTADRLAAWVQEHLTVDSSLDTTTLLGLARDALDTDSWVIEDEPFPVVSATRDGAAVLQPAAEAGAVAEWFRSSSGTEAPSVPAAGVPIGRCD